MNKRCICIFSAQYLPSMGGVEVYTSHLAQAFQEMGYRVIVVTNNTAHKPAKQTLGKMEIIRLPCTNAMNGRFPVTQSNLRSEELWNYLEKQNIDYAIINTRFYTLSLAALKFCKKIGVIPIVIEHGSAHLTAGSTVADKAVELVEHTMTTCGKRYPAYYYAVSTKASAWLEHFGLQSQGELPNSIDADHYKQSASGKDFCEQYHLDNNACIVAFVGRFVAEKGIRELAQASESLLNSNIVIMAAGTGPLDNELNDYESPNFHILGKLNPSDVAELLSTADVLCLPSRSEGFATTLLEAAACNTPAIVTDVGGVDELIPSNDYGILLEDTSAANIVQILATAASNKAQLRRMGRNVGELVRSNFSWNRTASLALEACEKAQQQS